MENKRIELILNNELICSISKRDITEYVEKLEKENAELKQQLQAKDKALDKACYLLCAYENKACMIGCNSKECDSCLGYRSAEKWKKRIEEIK